MDWYTIGDVVQGVLFGLVLARGLHLARIIGRGPTHSTCAWCGGNLTRMDDLARDVKMRRHLLSCERAPYVYPRGGRRG